MSATSIATVTPLNLIDFNKPRQKRDSQSKVYSLKGADELDDLLKTYIEKVDRDQVSLREDIRESERRVEKRVSESEERMEKRLERIEYLINQQNSNFESLKEKVSEKLEDDKKYRHTNNIAIVIGVIATALTMVGIYFATVSTISSLIPH